jgi:uncharacterized membrane protein
MDPRWAKVVYWTATTVAGLIVLVALASYFSNAAAGEPVIPIAALLLAGAIWLVGWVCRHVLAGR